MSKRDKPQWVAKKYMGDDRYSWAVVDKRYLPRGHRGVIYEWLPQGAVSYSGLSRDSARYYLKVRKSKDKDSQ